MKEIDAYVVTQVEQMNKDLNRLVRKKKFYTLPHQIKKLKEELVSDESFPAHLSSIPTTQSHMMCINYAYQTRM